MVKFEIVVLSAMVAASLAQLPHDPYHALHLPGAYTRYVRRQHAPGSGVFSCAGLRYGYYADAGSGCETYHLCRKGQVVATESCVEGTLFNEQFQVCDHFYNVRCGSPYEDL